MTRNERIAERIRKTWHAEDVCERVHDAFLDGEFDDLLGPEVSADLIKDIRDIFNVTSRSLFDRAWDSIGRAREYRSEHNTGLRAYLIALALKFRRLAKFMRQIERSVTV